MNSRVYCLPQKLGWNAITCTSEARAASKQRDGTVSSTKPFFSVQFNEPPVSAEARRRFKEQYPRLAERRHLSDQETLNTIYRSEYSRQYGPDSTAAYYKPPPPVTHEILADPLRRGRQVNPPFSSVTPPSYHVYDAHRGAHEWRDLTPKPGMYIWQPLQKIPINGNPGQRSTMLPVRLKQHDPDHEKERWDMIRNLVRNNAVSYGYRLKMPGYLGWRQEVEDVTSCVEQDVARANPVMVSSTHASHRHMPSSQEPGVSKPIGAACRLVTIGQLHDTLPQPSACD